jgi:hypothetical protein
MRNNSRRMASNKKQPNGLVNLNSLSIDEQANIDYLSKMFSEFSMKIIGGNDLYKFCEIAVDASTNIPRRSGILIIGFLNEKADIVQFVLIETIVNTFDGKRVESVEQEHLPLTFRKQDILTVLSKMAPNDANKTLYDALVKFISTTDMDDLFSTVNYENNYKRQRYGYDSLI